MGQAKTGRVNSKIRFYMFNVAKTLYEAFGIESPRLFSLVLGIIGFLLFGGFGLVLDRAYTRTMRDTAKDPLPTSSMTFSDTEQLVLRQSRELSKGSSVTLVQVGGTDARAVGSQIREAFLEAEWHVTFSVAGKMMITVVDEAGAGAVEPHGLYLLTKNPNDQPSRSIVSAFENARHPVSVNGSRALRPQGETTLYIIYQN